MLDISSFQNLTEDQLLATLIARSFDYTRNSRKCKAITDNDFINFAVERVMGEYCSGRDFLQYKNEIDGADIARATFLVRWTQVGAWTFLKISRKLLIMRLIIT